MTKQSISLTKLHRALSKVSSEAVINQLEIRNPSLRSYLQTVFSPSYGKGGDFLADPVIEATFGWKSADKGYSMRQLAGNGQLSETLVKCMDQAYAPDTYQQKTTDEAANKKRLGYADDINEDYSWPEDRPPYVHQLQAWDLLGADEPRSTVVTSGTGSGKTECFLVPLLNDLAIQVDNSGEPLAGVQAIMLYPLNALINSQRERLSAWTRGFGGNIRFALYTGETPEEPGSKSAKALRKPTPEQVDNRADIRKFPPPVLVTNSTMLEYMLVRPKDREILQKSQGKLRWIILDEAHTLVGTQAAEISLLLRRTMLAFGVQPKDVRFVATSATIGDSSNWESTQLKLKEFLAGLAGVSADQVSVVSGERLVPSLPEYHGELSSFSIETLEGMSSGEAYSTLSSMVLMRSLRARLAEQAMTMSEVAEHLFPNVKEVSDKERSLASQLLDVATNAYPDGDDNKEAFLRIRAHLFHRTQRGLWACVNPKCHHKVGSPLEEGWPFGKVYLEDRAFCMEGCGAPVYELTHCRECREPSLRAAIASDEKANRVLLPRISEEQDDFAYEVDPEFEQPEDVPLFELTKHDDVQVFSTTGAAVSRYRAVGGAVPAFLEPEGRKIKNHSDAGIPLLFTTADRDSVLRCACCDTTELVEGQTFKRAILGAPFLMGHLVPEMLRHVPRKNPDSLKGSRLITFTDSRQGTARFSAKLQLDAERRWCRSKIYRELSKKRECVDFAQDETVASYIRAREALSDESAKAEIQKLIDDRIAVLEKADGGWVGWNELCIALADSEVIKLLSGHPDLHDGQEDLSDSIPGEYQERDRHLSDAKELAHLFLLREFSRRPKNANNLETLGLVTVVYPALDQISEEDLRHTCHDWLKLGLALQDWRDYLKIVIDFFVRENVITDIRPYEVNWMGGKVYARLLRDQRFKASGEWEEQERAALRAFPSVNQGIQHRLVKMLELVTNRVAQEDPGLFDGILRAAWETLKKLKVLEYYEDERWTYRHGYHLKFDRAVAFKLTSHASLCPVTNRWLDTTFKGLSPYVTHKLELDDVRVVYGPVPIPHPGKALLDSRDTSLLRHWLSEQPFIVEQRLSGGWRDVTDDVILPPIHLRSAEHSAQQSSDNLKRYEKAFKKDFLNVLNCSTTMEMGVDIGSLSMVAMNNAPPSTANYLQRAGRAGRRGESTSVVLTLCKANPHGERIFAHPKWPFETGIPVPRVALESAPVVRRHVNAYLLATFINSQLSEESFPSLRAGQFFLPKGDVSHYQRFNAWCDQGAILDDQIRADLQTLTQGSALASQSVETLISSVAEAMVLAADHWASRHGALLSQLEPSLKSGDSEAKSAKGRLQKQVEDMEKTFLLKVLAQRGFLPGYGFPINVVELITNNKREKKTNKKGYPSRTLATALREYAPGKEVVLNGAVYRSQGLQLSWSVPGTDFEVPRAQKLRFVSYCLDCGYHEADLLATTDYPHGECLDCGSRRVKTMEYIVPEGFQVDYKTPLHNDYTKPDYAPFIEPFITVSDSRWQVLQSDDLGRFRISDSGQLFFFNDGNGAGYVMCWKCGRAEALRASGSQGECHIDENRSSNLQAKSSHNRLSGLSYSASSQCEVSDWSLKVSSSDPERDRLVLVPFVLGHEAATSMFELQLRDPDSGLWIEDSTAMYSLGAALRQVFCRNKGISVDEIGLAVHRRRTSERSTASSIFLFDTAEQGAGYSSSIVEELPELLQSAYKYANACPSNCDQACHGCLLDFDTRHHAENLDRHSVIELMDRLKLSERLSVPNERRFFGENSVIELNDAQRLIALKGRLAEAIDIFVSGSDWELSQATFLRQLGHLGGGKRIRIMLSSLIAESVSPELAWHLARMLDSSIEIHEFREVPGLDSEAFPVLRMKIAGTDYWYATDDETAISLNENWGKTRDASMVASKRASKSLDGRPLNLQELADRSSLQRNIALINEVGDQVNGPIQDFGRRLHDFICGHAKALDDLCLEGIKKVTYYDRYLMSPLSVLLICKYFQVLTEAYGGFQCEIETAHPSVGSGKAPYCVADNFKNSEDALSFISHIGDALGITVLTDLHEKYDLDHGRYLNIHLNSGKIVQVLFDQGMGYWSTRRPYNRQRFDFDAPGDEGRRVTGWDFQVRASGTGSYIVIHELD